MKISSLLVLSTIMATINFFSQPCSAQKTGIKSPAFSLFEDHLIQGKYEAKVLSDHQIISNYESPANLYVPADISFKFAINGRDNEMPSGQDHHLQ